MKTIADIEFTQAAQLLARYGLMLRHVADGEEIPGSYWGETEAGIIGSDVFVRSDTPVHSMMHEAGHLIVLPAEKRALVHTDATDSIEEENAVCLLQVLLGETLDGVTREDMFDDMDAWGYSFRLGSTKAYFEDDADDAWEWLRERRLVKAASRDLV